ncbi:MAG: DUF5050 domain-containing protein [Prevotellaceae bacterium]|jgi:hypothetical protein|nr:DUF5050 domain-containing protein [Prevotellaceae bacterium]
MKRLSLVLIATMALGLSICNAQNKTTERKLAGESFNIPVNFETSNEKFGTVIGGPKKIRLQTPEGYFVQITEGVGKYSLNPASSAQGLARRTVATKLTIAGKSFYKRPEYLYKNITYDYLDICSDLGTYQPNSQGYVINTSTGEIMDKKPRPLTDYVFDLGDNIFSITFEDKIPNHENLIKIFLGLDELAATERSMINQNKMGDSKDDVKNIGIYNLTNGGHMLQNGKDVYYSKWDGILYKTKIDKDDYDRIAIYRNENSNNIRCINIDGNTLYFYEDNKGICKIKTDGTGFKLVASSADLSGYVKTMILVEDLIFVNSSDELYMINKDTGEKRRISNESQKIEWITVYNGFLYAIVKDDFNDGSVMRIKFGSTKWEPVVKNLKATSILVDNDFIYYFSFYSADMYRIKHDGTDKKKISVDRGDTHFTMNSKWLFYRNGWGVISGNTTIEAFNKTNSAKEVEEFADGDISDSFGLYIIGNQLYYMDGSAMTKKPLSSK